MVRISPFIIFLFIANLAIYFLAGLFGFDGDIISVHNEISEFEKMLPQLQEQHQWAQDAKSCIENPPDANASQLMSKWNQMATRLGLEINEASQNTGQISELKLGLTGSFNNISMILNNISAEKAALVKQLKLEQADEGIWNLSLSVAIRSGPWEYSPTQQRNPAPVAIDIDTTAINSGKPFASQVFTKVRETVAIENVRYIGYFAEQATPAVIIESSGKYAVLKCGETTPGGALVFQADAEELKLRKKDASGKENVWTIKMEKK